MTTVPVVPVVGKSDSGKTTFIEKLIRELKSRGRRVAVIKHHPHDFDIDQPGKDSWRHAQAGADVVAISSPYKVAVIAKSSHDLSPEELEAQLIHGVDIVILEGYKSEPGPRIEVFRKAAGHELQSKESDLIALVTDTPFDMSVPQYELEDAEGVVDLLESRYLECSDLPAIDLVADGQTIPLEGFAKDIVSSGIMGLVSSLKGVDSPREVFIKIKL